MRSSVISVAIISTATEQDRYHCLLSRGAVARAILGENCRGCDLTYKIAVFIQSNIKLTLNLEKDLVYVYLRQERPFNI